MGASVLHIKTEVECKVYLFDEEKGIAIPGKYFNLEVRKGEQDLLFVSTEDEYYRYNLLYTVEEFDHDYNIVVEKQCFLSTRELITTKATKEEIADGIVDEYGVTYSRDGLHLLKCGHRNMGCYKVRQGCQVIRDLAFAFHTISSISLPTTLTHIGKSAFLECKGLTTIGLPASLVHIGERAFIRTQIKSVLSESTSFSYENGCLIDVKMKKVLAFLSSEYDVTLPSYIKSIGDSAFSNTISRIKLNNGLESIGRFAFFHCIGLREITFPSSLKNIGYGAFSETKLKKVTNFSTDIIYDKGCLIDKNSNALVAFLSNDKMIELPQGITHIGSCAFGKYNNPETIIVPEGVTTIEDHAFSNCNNLTTITLPSTLKRIGSEVFWQCFNLAQINLPIGLEQIEHDALLCCGNASSIISIPFGSKAHFESLLPEWDHGKLKEQPDIGRP
ncbi:MAG: hypothetical protein F082_1810 [bacterium F082]|nr:MAG: hypothetical protein F082_1810 [bacterium F082]KWW27898.1 MAG: hypothetical protein AUK64_1979 [bacterium P201]